MAQQMTKRSFRLRDCKNSQPLEDSGDVGAHASQEEAAEVQTVAEDFFLQKSPGWQMNVFQKHRVFF